MGWLVEKEVGDAFRVMLGRGKYDEKQGALSFTFLRKVPSMFSINDIFQFPVLCVIQGLVTLSYRDHIELLYLHEAVLEEDWQAATGPESSGTGNFWHFSLHPNNTAAK